VHAANTYLLDQFLRDSVNDRSGPYGGSIANRARLLLEVMQAIADEIGAGRTGVRLSPMTTFGDTPLDSDPQALYSYVVEQLAPLGLAYLHVIEGETGGARSRQMRNRLITRRCISISRVPGWSITALAGARHWKLSCRQGRPDRLRASVHQQPGSGPSPARRCAFERNAG
jgi:2,4-dienoyl-CoA reductase-like NADH-dependent reductase (Old Yellow Enzyme family)